MQTFSAQNPSTLSQYYPQGTSYFYGFPAGEDSNFFNAVPAWREELVAARPLLCAGNGVRVITFAPSLDPTLWRFMTEEWGVPLIDRSSILTLPQGITAQVYGKVRNARIKSALRRLTTPGSFIMAQPYLDDALRDRYQIDPALSIRLNDKIYRSTYIPKEYLPKEYRRFPNGESFSRDTRTFPFPCVVKISSSSSGDGVRICRADADFAEAKKDFAHCHGTIFVEEYISSAYNLGVLFGIPHDPQKPIDIIGYNEQITTERGDYLGGVVRKEQSIPIVKTIEQLLLRTILPAVRKLGWYGVGGLDVLITKEGRFFFIDPNFRMTAASSYVFLSHHGTVQRSLVSFTGMYKGTEEAFRALMRPLAAHGSHTQKIFVIALAKRRDTYLFNAGMLFDTDAEIHRNASLLLEQGIKSIVLNKLQRSFFTNSA